MLHQATTHPFLKNDIPRKVFLIFSQLKSETTSIYFALNSNFIAQTLHMTAFLNH